MAKRNRTEDGAAPKKDRANFHSIFQMDICWRNKRRISQRDWVLITNIIRLMNL